MTTLKKVAILTSVHYAFDTRIFYRISKSLVKHGYDVTLIAPSDDLTQTTKDGIKILPVKKQKNRFFRIFKTTHDVYRKALKTDAAICHFHDPELIFVGFLLKLRGKTVIYDIHENIPKQILTKNWVPLKRFVSLIYKFIERLFIKNFHLVLAEKSYESLYSYHKSKVTVQNFPNLDILPDIISEKEKNSIVYVGGVSKERGLENVIHALIKLNRKGYDFQFICIGPANESFKNHLEQLCIDNDIQEKVSFLGRLRAEDAYAIVKKSAIGLAILQPIKNYVESYPTKLFEYMALRTPYITSNFKLYTELTIDTKAGITIDPLNINDLKDALIELLEDQSKLKAMSENGRKAVEQKYNWTKEEEKLINLYKK
ncbi:glycosyltransferase family 4 protein [Bacillus thuringiensis]|uniref:glycosyltransferase family 4 protein n=1 Tax=Bacillus thuringiensis TaxID=1428 RepID=UPI003101672D